MRGARSCAGGPTPPHAQVQHIHPARLWLDPAHSPQLQCYCVQRPILVRPGERQCPELALMPPRCPNLPCMVACSARRIFPAPTLLPPLVPAFGSEAPRLPSAPPHASRPARLAGPSSPCLQFIVCSAWIYVIHLTGLGTNYRDARVFVDFFATNFMACRTPSATPSLPRPAPPPALNSQGLKFV